MERSSVVCLPGAAPRPPELTAKLTAAVDQATSVAPADSDRVAARPRFTNRLVLETSPYLRQHAHNPVDWYPWGDEAFDEARRSGKPVLLSVGYASCHWCHVMEEESFEDEEIAALLNANYVAVKVDREERPDVDAVYMACVQAWTGQGGWPMTVWLTPDRKPYYGGTYFPARDGDRGSHTGFETLLTELRRVYDEEPGRVETAGREIVKTIEERLAGTRAGALPDLTVLERAFNFYERAFDPTWGGLARPPKFPSSLPVRFLLRHARRDGGEARAMAELTLAKMAAGGMYDHVAGGFHRYSVDGEWLVPHFEKMLYDNALLALAYLEAVQVTGRADFAAVARETLDYLRREMTAEGGGFYCATDADSIVAPANGGRGRREEGHYFTWTPAELSAALGPALAAVASAYFGVTPGGNFEGRSILHTPRPAAEVAAALGKTEAALAADVAEIKCKLYAARQQRTPPPCDDKILAGWNGLAVSAFARGSRVLGEPGYGEVATRAAAFLKSHMEADGHLLRSYRDGPGRAAGFLEDYAFVIQGLLDLYEATFELEHLKEALRLTGDAETRFGDAEGGGFFMTASDQEALLVREKPAYDGAVPSGNSVMALNLLRLAALTGSPAYRHRAERTVMAFAETLARTPWALSEMLLAVDVLLDRPRQIMLVAPGDLAGVGPFLAELARSFQPNHVVAAATEADLARASALIPLLKGKHAAGGKPTAYLCIDTVCRRPVQDARAFADQLL